MQIASITLLTVQSGLHQGGVMRHLDVKVSGRFETVKTRSNSIGRFNLHMFASLLIERMMLFLQHIAVTLRDYHSKNFVPAMLGDA